MTTWNTDFEFDLQRFAGQLDLTVTIGNGTRSIKTYEHADLTNVGTAPDGTGTTFKLYSKTADGSVIAVYGGTPADMTGLNFITDITGDVNTGAVTLKTVNITSTFSDGIKIPASVGVSDTGSTKTVFELGTSGVKVAAASFTHSAVLGTVSAIADGATVSAGALIIDGVATANPASITLSGTGSVAFDKSKDVAATVNLGTTLGSVTITGTKNDTQVPTVTSAGVISDLQTGTVTRDTGKKFSFTATAGGALTVTADGVNAADGDIVANSDGLVISRGTGTAAESITVNSGATVTSVSATKLTVTKGDITATSFGSTAAAIEIDPGTSQEVTYNKMTFGTKATAAYTITGEKAVVIPASEKATLAAGTTLESITSNSVIYKPSSTAVATFDTTKGVTNFTAGEISITNDSGKFDQDGDGTAELTFTSGTATVTGGTALKVKSFTAGQVAGAKVEFTDGPTYTGVGGNVTLVVASNKEIGLSNGKAAATDGTYKIGSAAGAAIGDYVAVSTTDEVEITKAAAGTASAEVTKLATVGEKVTITDKDGSAGGATVTFEVVSEGVVKQTGGTNDGSYWVTSDAATFTDNGGSAGTYVGSKITTSKEMTAGTYYYNAVGVKVASTSTDIAAKLTVGSDRSIEVLSAVKQGVDVSNDTIKVTDKGTDTVYTLSTKASVIANKAAFTSTNGVVSSNTSGTLALQGTSDELEAVGTVNVDATKATGGKLTYKAGTSVDNAKVTLSASAYFTLTETNSGDTAEDTVIDIAGKKITGVDGDATIKTSGVTNADIATITTTGSGSFTFNKLTAVVAGDDNGVTFGFDTTTPTPVADTINVVTGLDADATITLGKLSGVASISVNTKNFQNVTAKNGAVFTGSKADRSDATITLFAKNDTVCDGTYTYVVESMGGASDGVVVGFNTLGALNDGDKVRVYQTTTTPTDATKYYEYVVNGNVMVVNAYTATDATTGNAAFAGSTTYTLSDPNDPGFTVGEAYKGDKINGDKGTDTETATFGTTASGTKQATSLTDGVFVNADGSLTTNGDKAVAKIGLENDVVTYTSQSTKAQVVNVTKSSDNWNVTTGAGKDEISFTGANVKSDVSINSGAGDDTIASSGTGDVLISAGDGKDSVLAGGSGDVQVSLGGGNDTITATGSGDLIIYGESGNNLINASAATGSVSIAGGSGNDTITAKSADDVVYGGDGKDVFDIRTKSVTISDYSFENDVVYVAGTAFGVTDEGKIATSGGTADISATAGDYYTAQINVGGTKSQNWAWAKDGGSNIDITSFEKNAHLQGDGDGANVLYAGSGDDYIYSYSEKDSVYGGAGKDSIVLSTASDDINRVVGVATTSGKDTVSGFKTGFSDGDSIFMVDGSASDVKASFDSSKSQVTFKDGSSSLQLDSIAAGKSGAVELKVGDAKLAVLASGAKATVDSASYADVFYGDGSVVDFSAVDEALSVNLSNNLSADGEGTKFVGVSSIIGGKGANTLMGSAKADSIVAGTGKSSLYGGAGADTLVGNSAEGDVFFFGAGTNTNTINAFQTADKETADTVKILGDVTSAKFANNAIELGTTDGSKAVIKSLASGSINANTMVKVDADNFKGIAKIGASSTANNFTYDKTVGYYGGGTQSDKLSVASNYADNAEVWLDGSKGVAYASVDVVDFSNGTGNYVLAGDSSKQVIVGGKGENSLWGGVGSVADSIKGGAGTNNFFYGLGEGNDTISSSNAEDTVNLYNISLSDVKAGEITNAGVMVEMKDGSTLAVATGKDITFKLASGETYVANHTSKGWDQA